VDGYEAVMAVAERRPDWVSVIRACFEYGDVTSFKRKWIFKEFAFPVTLEPLIGMGVLRKVGAGGADGNADWCFVDRVGAGRAIAELSAVA
jgi:hypothetical protein